MSPRPPPPSRRFPGSSPARERVIGQAGILDSARFANFIAEAAGVDVLTVKAVTLGSHGDTRVGDRPLLDVLDAATVDDLVRRTRDGGAEIVALLKTGSAYYAPSAAAAAMVAAVLTDSGEELPVCAWTTGQFGISDVYLGVLARSVPAGSSRSSNPT